MMSKARKGRVLPTRESLFWGLTVLRADVTRKKQAVFTTTRNSVSFLFDVKNLHGSLLRDYWRETILSFDVM